MDEPTSRKQKNQAMDGFGSHLRGRRGPNVINPTRTKILRYAAVCLILYLFYYLIIAHPPRGAKAVNRASSAATDCPLTGVRFCITMDAGSTGSRIHVYKFDWKHRGSVELLHETFEQLKPGLSSYKDPHDAAQSIIPLLEKAVAAVPPEDRFCTPIELKATAGLRLLGRERSDAILTSVYKVIQKYPFSVKGPKAVAVMDGTDEANFGWVTVNYLLKTITPDASLGAQTAAIIDMGGASTQIVFQPTIESSDTLPLEDLLLFGRHQKVFQKSYLGYGLMEASKKMMALRAEDKENEYTRFPCFPRGYAEEFEDIEAKNIRVSNAEGSQSFNDCHEISVSILRKNASCSETKCYINGVPQPNLNDFPGPIYAFSYYYDCLEHYLGSSDSLTVGEIGDVARKVCHSTAGNERNEGRHCMYVTYLYTLLANGYELSADRIIVIKKKIDGVETAWPLGAALALIQKMQ